MHNRLPLPKPPLPKPPPQRPLPQRPLPQKPLPQKLLLLKLPPLKPLLPLLLPKRPRLLLKLLKTQCKQRPHSLQNVLLLLQPQVLPLVVQHLKAPLLQKPQWRAAWKPCLRNKPGKCWMRKGPRYGALF
jgi:hypothetical protein